LNLVLAPGRTKNVLREAKRQAARATVTLLCQRYPKCFDLKNRRPLKVGIAHDLAHELAGAVSLPELKIALNMYCGDLGYLSAQRVGAPRLDLQGNEVGIVDRENEQRTTARLRGVKTARAKKVKQGRPTPQGDGFEALRRAARERKAREQAKSTT
jgi:ProP effector